MNVTLALLDRWKTQKGIESDNAAAKQLHITRSAISNWRTGVSHADAATLIRMASDLKEDPTGYVLAVESERSKSQKNREALANLAKKFLPFAATLLLAAFGREGNCKQLQSYTNIILHNAAHSIQRHGSWLWARKLLMLISQRLTGKLLWNFHLAASPVAA